MYQFQTLNRLLKRETFISEICHTNNTHSKSLKCVTHEQDLFAGIGPVETLHLFKQRRDSVTRDKNLKMKVSLIY